ncbi:helix-turn-helix domain-containing protein [Rufibacter latericius]|uniref:AraC family transcriptional regulator n=1 Tax=Rufibacter latericius TaxID=2487040 RepID=A0A3M9MJR1_9BACT|nr:helix-turn-helix domain-containing protein [Rufibacter latericius]RNI25726.1 AraC family transcriptional regulator [Rufibacter latericius]
MSTQAVQIILVGGAVQGLVLAFLLATRRTNQLANRLLAVLILLISLQSVLVAFDTREFFLAFPHLSKVSWLLPILFAPLIYLFSAKLTHENPRFRPLDALHFLPALLVFFYLLPYYLKSREEKIAYLNDFELASKDDFGFIGQLALVMVSFYLLLSLWNYRRYRREIANSFSEVEKIRLQWLLQFSLFMLVIIVVAIVAFYAKKLEVPVLIQIYRYHLHYFGVIGLIYWIGYKTLAQPRIFTEAPTAPEPSFPAQREEEPIPVLEPVLEELPPNTAPAVKYQKSTLREEDSQTYLDQLLTYMDTQKPYLEPTLTIQELSEKLGISKHHLSQIINNRLGKNFYDFINQYRVAEAQLMLVNPKFRHLTNLAVAEEAGFNSKATFNAVFKKQTGKTPSEYVRTHAENRLNSADEL